jgi:signal transduction histidine kinase
VITHLVWNKGEPDPRVLQSSFTLILVGVLVFRWLGDGPVSLVSLPVTGVAIAILGLLAVLCAPESRTVGLARTLAVVHIAALGMITHGASGAALPLLVFPSIWLGLELGLWGVALATGAVVTFIAVPGLVTQGTDLVTLERMLVLSAVAYFAAFATNAALTAARAAANRAEAREAELASALQVIERNRRSAQAIFEAVDVGLALLDGDGVPTLINQPLAAYSELAYPGGDLTDYWVFDENGQERLPIDEVPIARARRGEEFDGALVWIGRDEGSRRAVSISARRIEDGDGQMSGAAISYTDVTDFMRAQRVKDDFLALISHELRTPLTPIVGYVSMALERADLDPVLRKHLEVVARSGQRLERLVDDLLLEVDHAGRPLPLKKQPTDLAAIIRDSVAAAEPDAVRAGVSLVAELPDELTFTGDPQRLGQVVDNLLSNALKYTESGGAARVSAAADARAVVIRVRDTGIGIDPEDQEQLFTRFYRTGEASRRAIRGVGLGLSISKTIVESHGGLIELESEPGAGSEFRVVLPLQAPALAS